MHEGKRASRPPRCANSTDKTSLRVWRSCDYLVFFSCSACEQYCIINSSCHVVWPWPLTFRRTGRTTDKRSRWTHDWSALSMRSNNKSPHTKAYVQNAWHDRSHTTTRCCFELSIVLSVPVELSATISTVIHNGRVQRQQIQNIDTLLYAVEGLRAWFDTSRSSFAINSAVARSVRAICITTTLCENAIIKALHCTYFPYIFFRTVQCQHNLQRKTQNAEFDYHVENSYTAISVSPFHGQFFGERQFLATYSQSWGVYTEF